MRSLKASLGYTPLRQDSSRMLTLMLNQFTLNSGSRWSRLMEELLPITIKNLMVITSLPITVLNLRGLIKYHRLMLTTPINLLMELVLGETQRIVIDLITHL